MGDIGSEKLLGWKFRSDVFCHNKFFRFYLWFACGLGGRFTRSRRSAMRSD
jgi:hypothetical protein